MSANQDQKKSIETTILFPSAFCSTCTNLIFLASFKTLTNQISYFFKFLFLQSSQFNTDKINRLGFHKFFRDFSDKMWNNGKTILKYIVQVQINIQKLNKKPGFLHKMCFFLLNVFNQMYEKTLCIEVV